MHKLRAFFGAVALLLLALLCAAPAQAQATRTWVSGVGDDANPCSRTAPCKTFAGAISKTAAAGEINCEDPGGFGALTITKAIVINCKGTIGSVLVSGTAGITVAAGATDQVTLEGLEVEGIGTGTDGIDFNSGAVLKLDNVLIRDFSGNGIKVNNSGNPTVSISNVQVSHCGASGIALVIGGAKTIFASIDGVRLDQNGAGLLLDASASTGTARVTFRDSVASGNMNAGISALGGAGVLRLLSSQSSVVNNKLGLSAAGANAEILVSNTDITGNQTGLGATNGGSLISYGNNRLNGNVTAQGAFTSTTSPQ